MSKIEEIMSEIDRKNIVYYKNHKDKIDNLLLKNNSKLLKVFKQFPTCKLYRNSGSYMIPVKLSQTEERYLIISHYYAYIYQNGKLINLYKYNTHSSFVATHELKKVIREFGLSQTWAIFVLNFTRKYDLVQFKTDSMKNDLKLKTVFN